MERVKVWQREGPGDAQRARPVRDGAARALPHAAGRGGGAALRRRAARELRRARLRLPPAARALRGRWTVGELVAFHTAHKLLLLAHSEAALPPRSAGSSRRRSRLPRAELRERYEHGFMAALAKLATPRRHTNVLQHMVGYLRDGLDASDRAGARGAHRGLPARARAAGRAAHAAPPPRAPARRRVPARADLPRAAPEGADAAQPRVSSRAWRSCTSIPRGPRGAAGLPRGEVAIVDFTLDDDVMDVSRASRSPPNAAARADRASASSRA